MERIGVRELRQNASKYLDRVQAGESVEVTRDGKLVAVISPPHPARSARDRLVSEGRLIPAARPFAVPPRPKRRPGTPDSATVIDELRAERT